MTRRRGVASRIHAVCVVRDEADIIEQSLTAALQWADAVYVLDNDSTDGTWEILRRLAAEDARVELMGRHAGPFSNALRTQIVARMARRARLGDWWAWLDADEFFLDDPRPLLRQVGLQYGVIHSASIEYFFTDRDLAEYEADPARYVATW